jgi:hypothetical protein
MAVDVQACLAFMLRLALFIVCKAKKHLYFYKSFCEGRRFCVSNASSPAFYQSGYEKTKMKSLRIA